MKLTPSQYRAFFELYHEQELLAAESCAAPGSLRNTMHVAHLVYEESYGETKRLPVRIDKDSLWLPSMVNTTDGDTFVLISEKDFFGWDMNYLFAVLAHELGHFISGHLGSGQKESWLDKRVDAQKRTLVLAEQYSKLGNADRYYRRYSASCFSALLDGAVLDLELEADLVALRYVPVSDLISIHARDLLAVNHAVRLEKHNRIARLSSLLNNTHPALKMELVYVQRPVVEKDATNPPFKETYV